MGEFGAGCQLPRIALEYFGSGALANSLDRVTILLAVTVAVLAVGPLGLAVYE